eukprot:sb/3476822/
MRWKCSFRRECVLGHVRTCVKTCYNISRNHTADTINTRPGVIYFYLCFMRFGSSAYRSHAPRELYLKKKKGLNKTKSNGLLSLFHEIWEQLNGDLFQFCVTFLIHHEMHLVYV